MNNLQIFGLTTDSNLITVGDGALIDCRDVVFSKQDQVESRHAHIWDFASAGDLITTYVYTGIFQDTYDDSVQIVKRGATNQIYYIGASTVITGNLLSTPPVMGNTSPRMFNHKDRRYFLTWEGLNFNNNIPFRFPLLTATATASYPDNNSKAWLIPGYKVSLAFTTVIDMGNDNEPRLVESDPVFIEVNSKWAASSVNDTITNQYITTTASVVADTITVNFGSKIQMYCYRTIQVPENQALPTEYYLAAEPSTVLELGTSKSFTLTTNDDGIRILDRLYTNPSVDGIENSNYHVLPAKGVTQHKNYYFYYNIAHPGFQEFIMTTGGETAAANLQVSATNYLPNPSSSTGTISYSTTQQTNTSSPTLTIDDALLSYTGFDTNNRKLIIPVGTKRGKTVEQLRELFGITWSTVVSGKTLADTYNELGVIYISSAKLDGVAVLESPGIFVGVISGSSNAINIIISYKSSELINPDTSAYATPVIKLSECSIIQTAAGMSLFGTPPGTSIERGYFIPGTNPLNLPLYLSINQLGGINLSLLPTKGMPQDPVAVLGIEGTGTPWINFNSNVYEANVAWLGVLARSPAQLLDDKVKALVRTINLDSNGIFKAIKGNGVGDFTLIPRLPHLDLFNFSVSNVTNLNFVPSLTTSPVLHIKAENRKNAFLVSRLNNPEVVPISQIFAPFEVGDKNEAIQAMISSNNDLFILKERTIWKTSIYAGSNVPILDDISIYDSTTGCVSGGSAAEVNGEVIWLSEKGFISNIEPTIGQLISNEVREAVELCKTAGLLESITSFGNPLKRLYGCYIPSSSTVGTCYVFDTYMRKWSKWSLSPIAFTTLKDGKLTSIEKLVDGGTTYQYRRTDNAYYDEANQAEVSYTFVGSGSRFGNNITFSANTSLNRAALVASKNGLDTYVQDLSGTITKVTIASIPGGAVITDDGTLNIVAGWKLYLGVRSEVVFGPFTASEPGLMKQFSKYSVHLGNAVHGLKIAFKTDSRGDFTVDREFKTYAVNRNFAQSWIPVEAGRGRYLIRRVKHTYPLEFLRIVGQEYESRTYSSRSQKAPR